MKDGRRTRDDERVRSVDDSGSSKPNERKKPAATMSVSRRAYVGGVYPPSDMDTRRDRLRELEGDYGLFSSFPLLPWRRNSDLPEAKDKKVGLHNF